eukprot:8896342-Alexandrium_andersonii.AAC.1
MCVRVCAHERARAVYACACACAVVCACARALSAPTAARRGGVGRGPDQDRAVQVDPCHVQRIRPAGLAAMGRVDG